MTRSQHYSHYEAAVRNSTQLHHVLDPRGIAANQERESQPLYFYELVHHIQHQLLLAEIR